MKKIIFGFVTIIMAAIAAGELMNRRARGGSEDNESQGDEEVYEDQMSLNIAHGKCYKEYEESIEDEYQKLLTLLPQYKDVFKEEKTIWQKYQKAVRKHADMENRGSSTSMYIDDVLQQGVTLREASFHSLFLHRIGEPVSACQTMFTEELIAKAYAAFLKVISREQRQEYLTALKEEQRCWDEWMVHRRKNSPLLPEDIRTVYDDCTNKMRRTKLMQLKNQNNGLGMCGQGELDCVLPFDCSDKVLIEYPGFDVVWARHLKDFNWYPSFN